MDGSGSKSKLITDKERGAAFDKELHGLIALDRLSNSSRLHTVAHWVFTLPHSGALGFYSIAAPNRKSASPAACKLTESDWETQQEE